MLRYKNLLFIESKNYLFRYDTNYDRLDVFKNKNYKYNTLNKARETKIDSVYLREMVRIIFDGEYK